MFFFVPLLFAPLKAEKEDWDHKFVNALKAKKDQFIKEIKSIPSTIIFMEKSQLVWKFISSPITTIKCLLHPIVTIKGIFRTTSLRDMLTARFNLITRIMIGNLMPFRYRRHNTFLGTMIHFLVYKYCVIWLSGYVDHLMRFPWVSFPDYWNNRDITKILPLLYLSLCLFSLIELLPPPKKTLFELLPGYAPALGAGLLVCGVSALFLYHLKSQKPKLDTFETWDDQWDQSPSLPT